jgi:hypothetical protein
MEIFIRPRPIGRCAGCGFGVVHRWFAIIVTNFAVTAIKNLQGCEQPPFILTTYQFFYININLPDLFLPRALSQKHVSVLLVAVVIRPPEAGKPQADLKTTNPGQTDQQHEALLLPAKGKMAC